MPEFDYSSNSRLEQKRPKWNLFESSARAFTKSLQSKTLLITFGESIKHFPS